MFQIFKEKVASAAESLKTSDLSCVRQQIIMGYPPTKQLSSEEQDLVWKFRYYLTTQEKVGVLVYSALLLLNVLHVTGHPHPPPPLVPGTDKVPEVCELGSAPGGQAGPGAAGEVEADGRGGLPGAAVLPVHKPHGQTLRRDPPPAGRR